ncbi:hypothetical protein JCM5353_008129 [Sporobolomyces roseus]
MPPVDIPGSSTLVGMTYQTRLEQTNGLISLANSANPSLAIATLQEAFFDPCSAALSSPTFEALNRCTLAYALYRTGQHAQAMRELERVGEMILEDGGKTKYFEKIRDRAKNVARRKNMGIIKGVNDRPEDQVSGKSTNVKTSKSPLQTEFLSDFSIMNLGVESSSPGEEAEVEIEGVEKGGIGKEEEEDSIMA